MDTTVVAKLNDAVGGVTVTIPTDGMEKRDPAFVKGAQVTLHGDQAEAFVRYRDITRDFSALYRMDQQQEYITQYFKAVKEASRTDTQAVTHLFDLIRDYMVTDMSKDQYLKIAMDGLDAGNLTGQDFYTVPGTGETTENLRCVPGRPAGSHTHHTESVLPGRFMTGNIQHGSMLFIEINIPKREGR